MNFIAKIGAAALLGLLLIPSSGQAVPLPLTVTVDATLDPFSWLDTNVNLDAGTTYVFKVINPDTVWSATIGLPANDSTAAGVPGQTSVQLGFAADVGSLVGEAGSTYFLIGTGVTRAGLSGDLKVGFWDGLGGYSDNAGFQTLQISETPLPAALPLFASGLGALGLLGWRRKRKATITA